MTLEDALKNKGLTADQISKLMVKVARVFLKSDSIDQFYKSVQTICGKQSEEVALVIINDKFLPLADEIKGVRELLKQLGGDKEQGVTDELQMNEGGVHQNLKSSVPEATSTTTTTAPSSIVFSTDDDAEINQYKAGGATTVATDYDRLADAIIAEFGYTTSEETLRKRLKNNIIARLRGVRDNLEARELLEKSKKIGGLEFTAEQSSALLQLIARKMPQATVDAAANSSHITFPTQRPFAIPSRISLQEKKKYAPTAVATSVASDTPVANPVVNSVVVNKEELIVPVVAKPITPKTTESTVQPVIEEEDGLPVIRYTSPKPQVESNEGTSQVPATEVPIRTEVVMSAPEAPESVPMASQAAPVERPAIPLPQPQPYTASTPPLKPQAVVSRKPSLDGVKLVKQSVGPLDELSGMTLIDFRRLSQDPEAAAAKILEKIELLTGDSYGKRLEGIAAWRMSEVSKFYRLLGQASLNNHQSIEEVIADRLKTEKPTLSLAEFEAVMALNEKLRY